MALQGSRRWIKERLPAFICRETGWWVSRWIQCHIFLCSECRKEYRELKEVWDALDEWKVEDPEPECEGAFFETLRRKYPSALAGEEAAPVGAFAEWVPRLAYVFGVLALGVMIFLVNEPFPASRVQHFTVNPKQNEKQRVVEAAAPNPSPAEVTSSPNHSSPLAHNGPSPQDNYAALDLTAVRLFPRQPAITTSLGTPIAGHSANADLKSLRRTVEINNVPLIPMNGFESLVQPYEDDRPY